MRRFSMVIALALLLAIVVSVFGTLPSFAANDRETTYGAEVFNSNTSTLAFTHGDNYNNTEDPTRTVASAPNGVKMYKYAMIGSDAVNGDYSEVALGAKFQTAANTVKNSDFFVFDMDISTETTYIDGLYLHTLGTNAVGSDQNITSLYFSIRGEDNDTLRIGLNGNSTVVYGYAPYANDVWQHITFVYDLRNPSALKVYFYINGVYCGNSGAINASSWHSIDYFRISTETQTIINASTTIANLSIRRFEPGYSGPLTGDRMLGHQGTTLDRMPDLAYCLENVPDAGEVTPYADVKTADGTLRYTAYKWSELDASLQDGDVVTLYKSMMRPLIIPTGATIVFKDKNGKVLTPAIFNGANLETGEAADAVSILKAPVEYDYYDAQIVERQRSDYAVTGSGTDFSKVWAGNGYYIYTLLADITGTISGEGASGYEAIIDINGHTATLEAESGKHGLTSGVCVRFMDGSIIWNAGGYDFCMTGVNTLLSFENVNLTYNAGAFIDGRGGIVLFKDSNVARNPYKYSDKQYCNGSLVSIKSGTYNKSAMSVIVDNSDIDFSNVTIPSGFTFEENGHMFLMNAQDLNGIRYSDSKNYLTIRNGSKLKMANNCLIYACGYTSSEGTITTEKILNDSDKTKGNNKITSYTPNAAALANKNDNFVNILDSTIISSHAIIETSVELTGSRTVSNSTQKNVVIGTKVDPVTGETVNILGTVEWAGASWLVSATAFDYHNTINISGSDIRVNNTSVANVSRPDIISDELKDNFRYDVNINIDGKSNVSGAKSLVNRESDREVDMQISLADGVKLNTNHVIRDSDNGASVVTIFGSGASRIAYTSLGGDYGFVVTPDFDSYTYRLGTQTPVEFDWCNYNGEKVDINRVVTLDPGVANTYEYDWVINDKAYTAKIEPLFKLGSNLTLNSDIALNILIPVGVDLSKVTTTIHADCTPFDEPITYNGKSYYKYQIAGITPDTAETIYDVTVTIEGAYGDTLTKTFKASPVQYAQDTLNLESTKEDVELVDLLNALLNYFEAAYAYVGEVKDFTDVEVGDAAYGEAPVNTSDIVSSYTINLKSAFAFIITLKDGVENATATYSYNGEVKENVAIEGNKVYIYLKACDIIDGVTINAEGKTYTVNLATYVADYNADVEAGKLEADPKLEALLVAMSVYASCAKAYQTK